MRPARFSNWRSARHFGLGHNYIGTEHILLALLEAEGGDGPLHGLGIDKQRTEDEIIEVLRSLTET